MNKIKPILALVAAVGLALPAQAAIIGAVGGTINAGGPGFGTLTETFNQAGLSATYIPGVTDFDSFVASTTHTDIFAGFEWFSNEGGSSASVTYDLGGVKRIDKMALWNEEFAGIGVLDLLVSGDGVSFSSLLSGLTPNDSPSNLDYAAEVFGFAATAFRYIQLDMSGCPQPDGAGRVFCSIGEVAFNEVAAIPVPAAGFLLLGGLGGLAALRRGKRA